MNDAEHDNSHARLETQRWARIFRTGLVANIILVVLTLAYVALTPRGPHRGLIAALAVAFLVVLAALAFVPARRIAGAPWRMAFFHGWSITCLLLALLLIWLDGGVGSPTLLYLYMIMLFASLSYPVSSNVAYAVAGIGGYCLIALMQPVDPGFSTQHLFQLALLALAYGFSASIAYNHSALARANASMRLRLADMARRDALTGCLNRRGFAERLDHEIARSQRTRNPLSLLLIDLDQFKDVNDRMGHLQGDRVLQSVAQRLHGTARAADTFARLGGDEFVLLAPDTDANEARRIAQRLAAAVACIGMPCTVTLSIGVCAGVCVPSTCADDLLGWADRALYDVKRGGRNGVQLVDMPALRVGGVRAAI